MIFRVVVVVSLATLAACSCGGPSLPDPPVQCDGTGKGCLLDEECVEGVCVKLPPCENDDDCPLVAQLCVFPAQICEFRPGFSDECNIDADCNADELCALGDCLVLDQTRECSRRTDCPIGQACSQIHFRCIPEAPCTLADDFPEAACEELFEETCDPLSQRCILECQNECTVATEAEDCGVGRRCDAACRCVECLNEDDCGLGLICNVRAGRCESEDLCFDDNDCPNPLICDLETALCQVADPPCETNLDCRVSEFCNLNTGVCEPVLGECDDDRFEDADTPNTARELDVPNDGTFRFEDELQLCPDDDDVYSVALDPGDNLIVRISQTEIQARATLWLLEPSGERSLRFARNPPFGNGTVSYVAEVAETVFIRVNALEGQTPYEMEVGRIPGVACTADPFEGEAGNDSIETPTPAALVVTDVGLNASICIEDVDLYAFELEADEAVRATLTFDGVLADLDLAIVEPLSGAVLTQSAGVLSEEQVFLRSPGARTVLLRVKSFNLTAGDYQLFVERLPPFICEDDALEPDDTASAATLVPPGENLAPVDLTACEQDPDLFEVPMLDFERLVAVADFPAAEMDLEMSVLDADGNVLAVSPNSSDGETLTYSATEDQTVFVHVEAANNGQGAYGFEILRENQFACAPDALEPNGNIGASVIAPESASDLTLCDLDEDFFRVTGIGGKRLRARIAFNSGDGDLDLMLIGIDGEQPLAVSDGIGNSEEADAILPVDGDYFVRVFSLGAPSARYSIEVALEDP